MEFRKISLKFIYIILTSVTCFAQERKVNAFKKGDVRLDLKLPHFNYIAVNPEGKFKEDRFGFNGYGMGIEYNYTDKKFLETSLSFVLTFEWPLVIPMDREHGKEIYTYYFGLTDNFVVNRFTFGYGLNYSSNDWIEFYRYYDSLSVTPSSRTHYFNKTFGITLNSYYKIGKTFNLGIIYRPTFVKVNQQVEFMPEHMVSLELNWRFRLKSGSASSERSD